MAYQSGSLPFAWRADYERSNKVSSVVNTRTDKQGKQIMCIVELGNKVVLRGTFEECKEYVDKHGGIVLEPTGLLGFMCVAY